MKKFKKNNDKNNFKDKNHHKNWIILVKILIKVLFKERKQESHQKFIVNLLLCQKNRASPLLKSKNQYKKIKKIFLKLLKVKKCMNHLKLMLWNKNQNNYKRL